MSLAHSEELDTVLKETEPRIYRPPNYIGSSAPVVPDNIKEYAEIYFQAIQQAWIRTANRLNFQYEIIND